MASNPPPGFYQPPSGPMASNEWMGPRLRRIMESSQGAAAKGDISLPSYHAAVADGQEFKQHKQYQLAAYSFEFAITVARKVPVNQEHAMLDLMTDCATCQLKLKNYKRAGTLGKDCIDMRPDFAKGYLMMGKALAGGGEVETGACSLLDGMEKCQLNSDEWVDFIVEASQLLAPLKHELASFVGLAHPSSALTHILHSDPPLPSSETVWTRIMQQLFKRKAFKAVAFLVTGLPVEPIDFKFSSLETGCDCYEFPGFDVEEVYEALTPASSVLILSCVYQVYEALTPASSVLILSCVYQVYEALTPSELKMWGNMLINTLVLFEADICARSHDPEAVRIVRLALKYRTTSLLEQRLDTSGCDLIDVDTPDFHGDTALHIVAKSPAFGRLHEELILLLLSGGALPSVRDKHGKMPHEYLRKSTAAWNCFQAVLEAPEEKFLERIKQLKKKGNLAHREKNHVGAVEQYEKAVTLILRSPYKLAHDLAVLYSNMATVFASMNDDEMACNMARKSIEQDPTYHKPYWRLGKSLLDRKRYVEACNNFLLGTKCADADCDQKATFLVEICSTLSSLTEKQMEMILERMLPFLSACWPKMAENLSKNSLWDAMRRLVLGPPQIVVDKAAVNPGWRFADRFKDGPQLKVGYAMCHRANTTILSSLVEVVENRKIADVNSWATDLVLALLLQGAQLGTLVTGEEETCYHVALNLCCMTEKLGLLRYILSDETVVREARVAVNKEKRTLLHAACLQFGDGVHEVGKQLVKLLMEKGFDPMLRDVLQKKPVDYLAPRSPMSLLLARSPGDMKERGNAEFKKGRYREAVDYYTQAIDILSSKLPPLNDVQSMMGFEAEKHELAVLFSNRAECRLKLGQVEEAFADAKDSVAWDGHWYRGHVRVGRALLRRNKPQQAIKAFSNAFNALEAKAPDTQKKEVLKELMKTLMTVPGDPPDRIPHLGYVAPELWAMIAYDYFCEGNAAAEIGAGDAEGSWRAGHYAFVLFNKFFKTTPTLPKLQVNLKPLCTWRLTPGSDSLDTLWSMVLFFLRCGSDPTTLSFYNGDTYMHAAAFLTIMEICSPSAQGQTRILDWLLANFARPRREENLQDFEGNTPLHLMAMGNPPNHVPPLNPDLRYDLVEILLQRGVNPRVKNKQGKMAVECLSPCDPRKLRNLLEIATKKAPEPPKETSSLKKNGTEKPQRSDDNGRNTSNTDQQKPAAKDTPKPTPNGTSDQKNQKKNQPPATRTSESKRMDSQRPQCALCEDYLADARSFFLSNEKVKVGFSRLVSILGYTHQRDSRHAQFVSEALDLIVTQLSKSLAPDVPDVLLRLSQPHLHQVLDRLAAKDKWRQLEVVVDKARANDVPRGQFAKNLSILALVKDKGLCGAEAQRVQILNLLVTHGAKLTPGTQSREAMTVALQHAEFRLAERLMEIGAEPKYLSLEAGDTPLHAALNIALDRDKGNFSLFDTLLLLYEQDPQKHAILNPCTVDKAGNTLLHVAMQARYSKHSHKAVEMLVSYDIPVDAKNHEGKMAIDYLTNRADRRAQYLRVAGKQPATSKKDQKTEEEKPRPKSSSPPVAQNDSGDHQRDDIIKQQQQEELQPPDEPEPSDRPNTDQQSRGDRRDLKAKDAVGILNSLVNDLRDLTPAEAKIARSAKGKWLEVEKPVVDASRYRPDGPTKRIVVGEAEPEIQFEEGEDLDLGAFDNLEWEVECTAEVWKTLRDKRVPFELKQRIVKRIQLLASGEWRPYLCRKVKRAPSTLNLYQAKFSRGARILWELAIAFSPRLSEAAEKRIDEEGRKEEFAVRGGRVYTEIIRVWDIVFDNGKLLDSISRIIQSHSRGEHCLIQRQLKGVKSSQFQGGVTKRYPMLFSELDVGGDTRAAMEEREKDRMKLYPPASASEMEFHILKFYCFSSALVYNVLKNIEMKIDFPFRVTDREHAVINLRSGAPILLLGRSGTGKTTCCLYRLWSRFLTYWTKSREMDGAPWLPRTVQYVMSDNAEEDEEEDDPNAELFADSDKEEQENKEETTGATAARGSSLPSSLFVTKNQVLCSEVQKNFRELCHADDIASQHVVVEETNMPHRLQDIDEYKYPLFLTSRQLILMLDASLPPPHFFERNEDGSLRVMIQGDGGDRVAEEAAADHRPKKKDNRREVTYEIFAHEIWPRIIKKTQVNYHPSLVWTEITSFIKGSFGSLLQRRGYLDKDDYEKLGRKQAPNFTGSRDKVYELFRRYNDYKRQHGFYDEADLVFNIYQRLKTAGPLPWALHEVFVDETQDFTQAELTVLIRLAHNPNDMFLTGDTAQSIMRGVSFRFSDLKTLFHYAKQSLKARGKTGMLEVPKQVYQLTHNYRSHAGILSLASAVLDLLVEFFPESFDRLEKDQGLFDGPQPVVLESGSPADLAILLSGNKRKTSHIEFGAHQVILVVSEEARNNLPDELGLGLVLTIYEAKGLEFDDVLLYNFFKDSQASKEWRVVTDYLEKLSKNEVTASTSTDGLVEIDEDVLQQTGRPRPLAFDPNLHKILNSELKHLYTAVTRARVNVWIFDQHEEKRGPMFEYFKARKLVKFVSMRDGTDEEGVAQSMFAEKSSPEEWVKRGDEIMARSLYDVAAKCYAMAGDVRKQNIAIAHQRALEASHLRAQPRQMREAFLKAAILFLECHAKLSLQPESLACRYNLVMKAGRCLQNARENYLAAQVFEKNSQPEVAGPLYLRARRWLEASQCFEHVDNFNRALRILDEQELYDQAIDCLQRYKIRKQDFEKKGLALPKSLTDHKPEASFTVASLSYKAAMFYHRYKQTERMLAAIERLPNREDQIKFLQSHGYLLHAARLMCRTTEAARMMLHNGEVDRALLIAQEGSDSTLKAQCYWLKAQQLMAVKAAKKKVVTPLTAEVNEEKEAGKESSGSTEDKSSTKPKQTSVSSKKSKEESPPSSDEDEDDKPEDDRQQQILELLEKARQQFDVSKDLSGVGECQLVLSQLRLNKELLQNAFNSFENAQPVSNVAGMLECVEVLHKFIAAESMDITSCGRIIYGVERVFDAVQVLLKPTTAEDKNRYQVYLRFYGLEKSGENHLALHPKLKPRCVRMVGNRHLFADKEEKKRERLEKPADLICYHIGRFLIERTKEWCEEAEFFLSFRLPKVIQCRNYQEGHDCEDDQFCPYLHADYTEVVTQNAIGILTGQVRLDHAVQTGAEYLRKINDSLLQMALSMAKPDQAWNSVETLLDFLLPAGLPTYNMSSILTFCVDLQKKKPIYQGVHHQNPGRVGRGKSENVLKERCKSSDWIVLTSLLSPLLRLEIKVDGICKDLERDLAKKRPSWVNKRKKYALIKDGEAVITIARRHLDALEYLQQPGKFDPFEALCKFTKFVTMLSNRREISLMPDLRVFLFWLEVFTALAFCLAAKLRGNGNLVLPACYTRMLRLVNLTLPEARRGDLMMLLDQFKPKPERMQTVAILQQRAESLVDILCGWKVSNFSLLMHLAHLEKKKSTCYLLMERVLVLLLVQLMNVEHGNMPNIAEVPILRAVHRIDLTQLPDMPERLATLIASVQAATDYSGIITAVTTVLSGMQERLSIYQWRWNRRDREALQLNHGAAQFCGGRFRSFRPDVHLANSTYVNMAGSGAGDQAMDDIEEGGNIEEEEALSEEEKLRYQQERLEAQRHDLEKAASHKVTNFFRAIMIRKRVRKLKRYCILQVEKELFSPFIITDKIMEINFKNFREMYRSAISEPLLEIGAFLSHCQVKKLCKTVYADLPYQVTTVMQMLDHLHQMLNFFIQERKWTEREALIQHRHMLVQFFHTHVRPTVWQRFHHYQMLQKQTTASKEAERQHQERLMEDMVEDPNMADILDVVDRPLQQPPPQNAAGGGGVINAVFHRGRGRGRPQRGRGGRPQGGNEEFSQFAKVNVIYVCTKQATSSCSYCTKQATSSCSYCTKQATSSCRCCTKQATSSCRCCTKQATSSCRCCTKQQLVPVVAALSKQLVPVVAALSKQLVPVVTALSKQLVPVVAALSKQLVPVVAALSKQLVPVVAALSKQLVPVVAALSKQLVPVVAALSKQLVPVVAALSKQLVPVVAALSKQLVPVVAALSKQLVPVVAALSKQLVPVVAALSKQLVPVVAALSKQLVPVVTALSKQLVLVVTVLH
ncbi:hypothetical protein BaRGS_00027874 [Batillaria attramentaria]|uniref:Uncharacterized protein n=1 Tax=Batillaria attramentaria TaxID=370345 RepID=A0ABD0K133_9CAEN